MKYGLMYYKDTDNIGDDIQTYAAKRFLPHIDYCIDREDLNCFIPEQKEYVSMIMNAWYIHNKCAWPPSPYINPLLISMHFMSIDTTDVGDNYLKGLGGEYLKKYGPVGARDIETQKRLEKNGIQSYFSGCMTLTLQRFNNIEKTNKIYLVDAEESIIKKVKEENTEFDIETLTHRVEPDVINKKSIDERMEDVENLLKKYQSAHLVITNRLHVALPCLALGTPVILVHKEWYDEDRLGAFLKFVTNYTDKEFAQMDITEILKNPPSNNEEFKKIANKLVESCTSFIEKCEKEDIDTSLLPDVKEYEENYVSKIRWYKNLFELERISLEKTEAKRVKEYEERHQEIIFLNSELDNLRKECEKMYIENKNLQEKIERVYNSRGWKALEKIRKVLGKNS